MLKPNWNIGQLLHLNTFCSTFNILKVVLLCLLLAAASSVLAFNEEINYQGKLTDNLGATVTDGTYNMAFHLYTEAGVVIWSSTTTVPVASGLFSHMLGSSTPLTGVDFNQTLYLGVEIGGTGSPSWDGEMSRPSIRKGRRGLGHEISLDGGAWTGKLRQPAERA